MACEDRHLNRGRRRRRRRRRRGHLQRRRPRRGPRPWRRRAPEWRPGRRTWRRVLCDGLPRGLLHRAPPGGRWMPALGCGPPRRLARRPLDRCMRRPVRRQCNWPRMRSGYRFSAGWSGDGFPLGRPMYGPTVGSGVRSTMRCRPRGRLVRPPDRPPDGPLVRCIRQHPPALSSADGWACSGLDNG